MKTNWRETFFLCAFSTLMTLLILSMVNLWISNRVTALGVETIAANNLRDSYEILESRLAVEDGNFPIARLQSSTAYKGHLATLDAYAERLKILKENDRIRSRGLSGLTLIVSFIYFISAMQLRKERIAKTLGLPLKP